MSFIQKYLVNINVSFHVPQPLNESIHHHIHQRYNKYILFTIDDTYILLGDARAPPRSRTLLTSHQCLQKAFTACGCG